jgi:hypothetical protein
MDRYEIQVADLVDRRRARSLGCQGSRPRSGDGTALMFTAVDQAALYGLLARLRDSGIRLVAVNPLPEPIPEPAPEPTDAGREGGPHVPD